MAYIKCRTCGVDHRYRFGRETGASCTREDLYQRVLDLLKEIDQLKAQLENEKKRYDNDV